MARDVQRTGGGGGGERGGVTSCLRVPGGT